LLLVLFFIVIIVILAYPSVCDCGFHLRWSCMLHGSKWWSRYECI